MLAAAAISSAALYILLRQTVLAATQDAFQKLFNGTDFIKMLDYALSSKSAYYKMAKNIDTGTFYKAVEKVALAVALIAAVFNVLDDASRMRASPAVLIRNLVIFCLVAELIVHAGSISEGLDTLGTALRDATKSWAGTARTSYSVADWDTVWDAQDNNGFLAWLAKAAIFLFTCFGMILVKIRIYQQAFVVLIELAIIKLFLPLGIAWLPLEGVRGRGLSYFKWYVGIYIRIGIFYVIATLAARFMTIAAGRNIASFDTVCIILSLCMMVPSVMSSSSVLVRGIINA